MYGVLYFEIKLVLAVSIKDVIVYRSLPKVYLNSTTQIVCPLRDNNSPGEMFS